MNSVVRCLSQSGIGDNVPKRTYWKREEAVERLEIKTGKVTRGVGGGEKSWWSGDVMENQCDWRA